MNVRKLILILIDTAIYAAVAVLALLVSLLKEAPVTVKGIWYVVNVLIGIACIFKYTTIKIRIQPIIAVYKRNIFALCTIYAGPAGGHNTVVFRMEHSNPLIRQGVLIANTSAAIGGTIIYDN